MAPEGSAGEEACIGPRLEMDPERMRSLGYHAVDLLVERWGGLGDDAVWGGGSREEMEALLREPPPESGRDAERVLGRAVGEVLVRAGRIDHPRFFAFIPSSPTWPSVLGDLLATGYNVFQGTWLESAGPSQLELVVLDWFREWLGLPPGAGGLLTSGGSAANLGALVAARHAAGADAERGVVYVSDQGHSSLERAARVAGVPAERIRRVAVDDRYRMVPEALRSSLARDREAGLRPLCVCASAGTTNTGAVDPLPALARLCSEEEAWFHVDAAWGGFAVLTEEGRDALTGIGEADSVTLDPHKWLYQPYETGCLLVRDVRRLEAAFRILPEYLQDTDLGAAQVNFADRGVQLSRAFRALKIWVSVQTLGVGAFREAVGRSLELARRADAWIRRSEGLELLSPASLAIVGFRARPPGGPTDVEALAELNGRVAERLFRSGFAMLSSTRLRGAFALRLCVMNYRTRWDDVVQTLRRVEALGAEEAG